MLDCAIMIQVLLSSVYCTVDVHLSVTGWCPRGQDGASHQLGRLDRRPKTLIICFSGTFDKNQAE